MNCDLYNQYLFEGWKDCFHILPFQTKYYNKYSLIFIFVNMCKYICRLNSLKNLVALWKVMKVKSYFPKYHNKFKCIQSWNYYQKNENFFCVCDFGARKAFLRLTQTQNSHRKVEIWLYLKKKVCMAKNSKNQI